MTARQSVDKRKRATPYLFQRVKRQGKDNTWYCRVAVPPSLRHLFNGKRNLVRSLNTKNLAHAKLQRDDAVAALKKMLRDAKAANPSNAGDVVRDAQLKALQEKWQHKIKRDAAGMAQPLSAKDRAEYQADAALARALGSQKVAESLGVTTFEKATTPLDHLEKDWFEAASLTYRTRLHYRHCRELLAEHLRREGLPETIESVTSTVALSFRKYLVAQRTFPTTGNSYLGGLRSRWAMLIEEEVIEPPNPFASISMKASSRGSEPARRPYNAGELVTLMTGDMPQPLFSIVSLLLVSGQRRNEVLAMKVKDVQGEWMQITAGKSKSAVRRVPVASILRDGMARLISGRTPDDFLIDLGDRSLNAKANRVTGAFKAYRQDVAGLKDPALVLHSTRHVWASLALESGVQFHVAQAVLGHSPAGGQAVTAGYGHARLMDVPKREAIEAVVKALPAPVVQVVARRFGRP